MIYQLIDGSNADFFEHAVDLFAEWAVVSPCKVIVDHGEGFLRIIVQVAKVSKVCEKINKKPCQVGISRQGFYGFRFSARSKIIDYLVLTNFVVKTGP